MIIEIRLHEYRLIERLFSFIVRFYGIDFPLLYYIYVCVSCECYLLSISEHKMPKAFRFEPKMIESFTLSLCFHPFFTFCFIFACLLNNNDDLVLHESSVAMMVHGIWMKRYYFFVFRFLCTLFLIQYNITAPLPVNRTFSILKPQPTRE